MAPRHVYGPRALGALLGPVLRPAWRRRAPATAQLLMDWDSIVGPAIARDTMPRRLAGGTLAISCNGPVAMELQHLSDALIARINSHFGQKLVQRLRFMQDGSDIGRPSPDLPPPPSQQATQEAAHAVRDLPEGALRDALAALGRAVLSRR